MFKRTARDGRAYRVVTPRQTLVRLSRQQRSDLAEALEPTTLTTGLREKVEDALYVCHIRQRLRERKKSKGRRPWAKQIAAGERLERMLHEHMGLGHELKKPLRRAIQAWREATKNTSRPTGSPKDDAALHLGLDVAWALDDFGLQLSVRRQNTEFMDVLRLVRRWADELEGRTSPPRKNIYNFAADILRRYKPWRTRVVKQERTFERWQTNYERRRDGKPAGNRARSLKSSDSR